MNAIKKIDAKTTFAVRHPVLRAGKPLESCMFEGDTLDSTIHFGYYIDDVLVGVASVFKKSHPNFKTEKQYQLRGMAVLENYQKKGIGEALVKTAEAYVKSENLNFIWFNARAIAVPFYKKLGYHIQGQEFDIPNIGPHYLMYKHLN
jgi:GNAT superfamily N-acetyltransferase